MMRLRQLPDRVYGPDATGRKRVFGPNTPLNHPAKMRCGLVEDLVYRYTKPGHIIIDPFLGCGTILIAVLMGRSVLGYELEPKFVAMAEQNYAYLRDHPLPGQPLGWARIEQADSRTLPLPDASVSGCTTSPPYGDSETGVLPSGQIAMEYAANESAQKLSDRTERRAALWSPGNIGNLPTSAITSPPYAEAVQYAETLDPEKVVAAQQRAMAKHPERPFMPPQGNTPGNIGNLASCAMTSPPYSDVDLGDISRRLSPERKVARLRAEGKHREADSVARNSSGAHSVFRYEGYGPHPDNISNLAATITSPPYADVASRDRATEPYALAQKPELARKYGRAYAENHRSIDGYGHSEGQIGDLESAITSPPYAESNLELLEGMSGTERGQLPATARNVLPQGYMGRDNRRVAALAPGSYEAAMQQVYAELYRVIQPGGCLVIVVGPMVRQQQIIPLDEQAIDLAVSVGWQPVETWLALKSTLSFWRILNKRRGFPVVDYERVIALVKEYQGWEWTDMLPRPGLSYRARQAVVQEKLW